MENVFNIVSLLEGIIIINVDIKVTMSLKMLYIVLCRMSSTFKTMLQLQSNERKHTCSTIMSRE